jgi:putative membrane protein
MPGRRGFVPLPGLTIKAVIFLLMLFLKGTAVGAANVMPGISGATLAVIFRVYDSLIAAINGLTKDWRKSFGFLIPFGLGMVLGIVAVGSVLSIFIRMFSFQSAGFIAGLMAGSIPFLYETAKGKSRKSPLYYLAAGIAAVVIILLAVFVPTPELYIEGSPGFGAVVLLFFGGLLSAAAMVVPGVSGAMVLILMGLFPLAMDTINQIRSYIMTPFHFELLPPILWVVAPLGLGIVLGVLLAGKGIAFLLEKYFSLTYFIIIGLVFGTVFALFADSRTYQSGDLSTFSVIAAVVLCVVGIILALKLGKQKRGDKATP